MVTRAAGAVDGRSRLVAVGVLVAAAVVLGAEVWSCPGPEFRCLRQRVGFSLAWVKLAVVRSHPHPPPPPPPTPDRPCWAEGYSRGSGMQKEPLPWKPG